MNGDFQNIQQIAGNGASDTVGDPGDQQFITGKKFARYATNPQAVATSIGSMIKKAAVSSVKLRRKRGGK